MVYKAYGCCVVDTETRSIKAIHIPVILDLVQDRVRSRVYSVLLTILIIIAVSYWALGPAFRDPNYPVPPPPISQVKIALPGSYSVTNGGTLSPPLLVAVLSSDNSPLASRLVLLVALPVQLDDKNELAFLPFKATMGGMLTQLTDTAGSVQFSNITFGGNSQIQYKLYCVCEGVTSNSIIVTVTTQVSSVSFISTPNIKLTPIIGQPILYPFIIQVLDTRGNPLPNKEVIATINPFADVNAILPAYGILGNFKQVTNSSGVAVFDSLTVIATTQAQFNFKFYSEGISLTPSVTELAIACKSNVTDIEIRGFPSVVFEGNTFRATIGVYDSFGNPVSNKTVIAVVTKENGYRAYPPVLTVHKILHNVVSVPNKNLSEFSTLSFDSAGFAGSYGITFYCDGIASQEQQIFVYSSVSNMQLLSPSAVTISDNDPTNLKIPLVIAASITDADKSPIADKVVSISAKIGTAVLPFAYLISDENGRVTFVITSIPYVFGVIDADLYIACENQSYRIDLTFDFAIASQRPTIVVPNADLFATTQYSVVTKTGWQPNVNVINGTKKSDNSNYNINAIWADSSNYIYYFPFYLSQQQGYTLQGSGATNSSGDVNFLTPFGFSSGVSGAVAVTFGCTNCSSPFVYIAQVENPIQSILLTTPLSANSTIYRITPGGQLGFSVTLLGTISADYLQTLYPTIAVLQGESFSMYGTASQVFSLFGGNGQTVQMSDDSRFSAAWLGFASSTPCSSLSTTYGGCTFGDMYVTNGLPGRYTLAVVVAGVVSNSITIEIGNEVSMLVPMAPVTNTLSVTLDQQFSVAAAVQVLGHQNTPLSGYFVTIMSCNQSNLQIVNEEANCTTCFLSSNSSDENGIAQFNNLKIISGLSGTYSLCFKLNDVGPIPWNVSISFTNSITLAVIESFNGLVVPDTQYLASFVITSSLAVSNFQAAVVFTQLQGTGQLELVYQPRYCIINLGVTQCRIFYTVSGDSGYYSFGVTIAGYKLATSISLLLNTIPVSMDVYSSDGYNIKPTTSFAAVIFEAATLLVKVQLPGDTPYLDADLTLDLISSPFGSLPAKYATSLSNRNSAEFIFLSVIFTSGVTGTYQFLLTSTPLSSLITINLTNTITNITMLDPYAMALIPVYFGEYVPYRITMEVIGSLCINRSVNAFLKGFKEGALYYGTPKTYPTEQPGVCEAYFDYVLLTTTVPGLYQLEAEIDGVVSNPFYILLENPDYPNYDRLSLENAQATVVVGVILMIPLYIGNSARHAAWYMLISLPALGIVGSITYTYLSAEISPSVIQSLGGNYFALALVLRLILIGTLLAFIGVVIIQIRGHRKKLPTTAFEAKMKACEEYVRRALLSCGVMGSHASIAVNIAHDEPQSRTSFFARIKPKEQHEAAFYYPQRLWIGCTASLVCSFIVSLGCNQLTAYAMEQLDDYHTLASSMINTAQRLQDFTGGANLTTLTYDMSTVLNASPQQIQDIIDAIQDETQLSLKYGTKAAVFVYNSQGIIYNASMAALGLAGAVYLACWFFVFKTYKRRIFMLRKGKLGDIILAKKHFTMDKAANYVGLQALHSSLAYFILWFVFTSIVTILQVKQFWLWIYSYYPVLLTFLVGFPFISKTIARLVVSKWIFKEGVILHLRLWLIYDFMWIFVNMLAAFVLSVIRYTISFFINIIYTMRMDHPLLREEIEHYDYGFTSYMGMLIMDHSFNNPIFLQFCNLLLQDFKATRLLRKNKLMEYAKSKCRFCCCRMFMVIEEEPMYAPLVNYNAKARIKSKWWLLITLHNNPSLRALRKHALNLQQQTKK